MIKDNLSITSKPDEWLTINDLIKELNISRSTAYRMVSNLPAKRFGRSIRISRRDLNLYLIEHDKVPTSK